MAPASRNEKTQVKPRPGDGATKIKPRPTSAGEATTHDIEADEDRAAEQAAKDVLQDPDKRKQVEAAKNVIFQLLKGIKTIGMYRHAEEKFPEFLHNAWQNLESYTQAWGPLAVRVDINNFILHKQELFNEESPIPYKFFREGFRQLIFRPGMTSQELVSFTMIALSDPERGADDLNAQFWRAQLPSFEYIMSEGFKMDEAGEEEVEVEVDKVVDYLQRRLRTNSDDYLRFARVSADDLDAKLDGVDQMRGVVIGGVTADADLKARLQREIGEEEGQRLFPKLISAVFQVVEAGIDDAALLEDMFVQLLDAMLLQEDFPAITQVFLKLKAMAQRGGEGSPIARLYATFAAKMGEEQRLSRVGDILRSSKPKSPQDVVRYLSAIDASSVPVLLAVLETIELPENRQMILDAVIPHAKEIPDPFVNRLRSDKPQTVRDMVYVLDRANHPEKIKFFGQVLASPNLALRLEVINIVAKGRTGESRKLIAQCLEDSNQQVRLLAMRVLPEFDRDKAYVDLMKLIKDESFQKREPVERQALYSALGSTGLPGALSYFQQVLETKSGLFNKAKIDADKLLSLHGLAGAGSIQALKFLQTVAEDKGSSAEVSSTARVLAFKLKKQLFGETAKEE